MDLIDNEVLYEPERMLRFVRSDMLLNMMYKNLGENKEILEALFYSEVYEDSAMIQEYLKF